jgi:hypothetical protein
VHWNRPGLLVTRGRIFVAFGSGPPEDEHEEDFVYHGWLLSFAADALSEPPTVFCTTPDGRGGSVWQGGSGVAADDDHVYLAGANGILGNTVFPPSAFPASPRGAEDSVARLPIAGATTMTGRYWDERPYHEDGNVFQYTESGDNGFGSAGPALIPGTRDLIVTGKNGMVYLLDRDGMRQRQEPLLPFTELPLQPGHSLYIHSWWGIPVCTSLVYLGSSTGTGAGGQVYGWASQDLLESFRYDGAQHTLTLERTAAAPAIANGGELAVSSGGGDPATAVVWAWTRQPGNANAGRIWAFDAQTLGELWHADTPSFQKLTPPTVVRGHVLVAATGAASAAKAILDFALPGAP